MVVRTATVRFPRRRVDLGMVNAVRAARGARPLTQEEADRLLAAREGQPGLEPNAYLAQVDP